jgi:hypothetical protein
MKTQPFSTSTKLLVFAASMAFMISSCETDDKDSKPSDYIGVWAMEQTVSTEAGNIELKDIITFTQSNFTEVAKIMDTTTGNWIDFIGRKGDITVSSGGMDVSLTEAGTTSVDISGNPTGVIIYYKEGTDEFSEMLISFEMSKDYKAKYTIADNKLTLKADNNNNGSFEDEDEVHIFTNQ